MPSIAGQYACLECGCLAVEFPVDWGQSGGSRIAGRPAGFGPSLDFEGCHRDYKGTGGGSISAWKAGEGHHIAFTYSSRPVRQRVYVDGGVISEGTSSMPAPALDGSGFMIGPFDSQFAVDELQISKDQR
jgi:hypothetical protein